MFDARVPNGRFRKCPILAMGSGASWGRLELKGPRRPRRFETPDSREELFVCSLDIENYFYALKTCPS